MSKSLVPAVSSQRTNTAQTARSVLWLLASATLGLCIGTMLMFHLASQSMSDAEDCHDKSVLTAHSVRLVDEFGREMWVRPAFERRGLYITDKHGTTLLDVPDPVALVSPAANEKPIAKCAFDNADISRQARWVPNIKNGEPFGTKVYAIRPDSLPARLGLENGDTLLSVAKLSQAVSPDEVEAEFNRLHTYDAFVIRLQRRGQTLALHYRVADGTCEPSPKASNQKK